MILQTLPAACGWRLFKIQGQLDFTAAPAVQAALSYVSAHDPSDLLIDLEDVKKADEVGVSALKSVVRRLLADHQQLHVAVIAKDAWLAEALNDESLSPRVPVYHSGDEALHAISLHRAA